MPRTKKQAKEMAGKVTVRRQTLSDMSRDEYEEKMRQMMRGRGKTMSGHKPPDKHVVAATTNIPVAGSVSRPDHIHVGSNSYHGGS